MTAEQDINFRTNLKSLVLRMTLKERQELLKAWKKRIQ